MSSLFLFGDVNFPFDLRWTNSASLLALYSSILLFLLLIVCLVTLRSYFTLFGGRKANSFKTTGEDVSAFAQRLSRVHANFYENFPVVGGLLLLAIATGQTAVTDGLALYMFGARFGQTVIHLISTNEKAVFLRFAFFLIQLIIAFYWLFAFGQKWFT